MEKLFLTVEETAEYLQLPKSKIYELCNNRNIPCTKIGLYWRIHKEKLDKWANKSCY